MHSTAKKDRPVAVVGATGHTGGFVLDELQRRGMRAILIGRDQHKLAIVSSAHHGEEVRVARLDDSVSLDKALEDASAVINCAGPFLDTALPVVDAALRAKIPYLDLTAEQAAVQLLESRDATARQAQVVIIPAAAFYGGLADLLVTSAVHGLQNVDEIVVAVALDSWHPTQGTRLTGQRNTAPRLVVRDGCLKPVRDPRPKRSWVFPAPFGKQEVTMLPFSETITIARHFNATSIESWINLTALRDVADPATPSPQPTDAGGRSAQKFVMDILIRAGQRCWRATADGHDIYAVSAPIIVQTLQRILYGEAAGISGVRSLGEMFDTHAFLENLMRDGCLRVRYETRVDAL